VAVSRPIVFLTDFGEDGFYAGILRAVAASASPASLLIDLSHQLKPHDIRLASFVLALSLDYLPRDAVVVAVVDPGVGSVRRALIAELDGRVAVLPDNGLLSDTLAMSPADRVLAISEDAARGVAGPFARGATFHGRDLFAPVAARLARGARPDDFGGPAGGVVMLRDVPSVSLEAGRVSGTGRMIDAFGNILTDIPRALVQRTLSGGSCRVSVGGVDVGPLCRTYADGAPGELIAIVNSWDRVEAAVREGRASDRFPGMDPSQIRFELREV
jgi:S-adenosylmethionine hydrolase